MTELRNKYKRSHNLIFFPLMNIFMNQLNTRMNESEIIIVKN